MLAHFVSIPSPIVLQEDKMYILPVSGLSNSAKSFSLCRVDEWIPLKIICLVLKLESGNSSSLILVNTFLKSVMFLGFENSFTTELLCFSLSLTPE